MANQNNDKWEAYKTAVPGLNNLIAGKDEVADDEAVDYSNFAANLPEDVAKQLNAIKVEDYEKVLAKTIEHRWCLCDMPEGEFPRIHSYLNLSSLVEALAKREGKETAVWAMYGVPLILTKALTRGSDDEKELYRYLLLPNQMATIVAHKEPFKLIAQDNIPEEHLEPEESGWLGDPAFLTSDQFFLPKTISNNQLSADPDMDEEDSGSGEPVE